MLVSAKSVMSLFLEIRFVGKADALTKSVGLKEQGSLSPLVPAISHDLGSLGRPDAHSPRTIETVGGNYFCSAAGAYICSAYSFTIRRVLKRGMVVRIASFTIFSQRRGTLLLSRS